MTHVSEQWMDGFVSAVKSAGYDESAIPRILKLAKLAEARRANPDEFDSAFEKQASIMGVLMKIAMALGLGYGGYRLIKQMYDRRINPTTQKATSLGDAYPNTFGPGSNPLSDMHSGGANPFLGKYNIDHTPVAPAQLTTKNNPTKATWANFAPRPVTDAYGQRIATPNYSFPAPSLDDIYTPAAVAGR